MEEKKLPEAAVGNIGAGMPPLTVKVKKAEIKKPIVLKNTRGEVVPQKDYFYSITGEDSAPPYFYDMCGDPVTREDMLEVFHKIFKPEDNFLFYKARDKEFYLVIASIKYSDTLGEEHNSVDGDAQKHGISFVAEGAVNLDTLRMRLLRVASTIKGINK